MCFRFHGVRALGPITIENDRLRVEIRPDLGGGLAGFLARGPHGSWAPILRAAPAGARWFNDLACYLLCPWSNRIARGVFRWRGQEYRLMPDWPDGTAIHGRVKDRPMRILDRSPVSARLGFDSREARMDWPMAFGCTLRYELRGSSLAMEACVENRSGQPMPCGLGFHPFFLRRLWDDRDDVRMRCRLVGRYPAAGMIPTGPAGPDPLLEHFAEGRALGGLALDDVFLGSLDGAAIEWPASGVRALLACSGSLGHTVVYTGRASDAHAFFCAEPVTMVNDGFNLAEGGRGSTGVAELARGGRLDATFSISIEGV